MSWTYSDWVTYRVSNPATALQRGNLHIQEVSDKITRDCQAHGYGVQNHPLNDYIKQLYEKVDAILGSGAVAGGVSLAVLSDDDC